MYMSVSLDPNARTRCKGCQILLSPNLPYKNCPECRAKNRIKQALQLERKRQRESWRRLNTTSDAKENVTNPRSSFGDTMKKPRVPLKYHELDEDRKGVLMKELKVQLTTQADQNGTKMSTTDDQSVPSIAQDNIREFLMADDLYQKLRSKARQASELGKKPKFHGCHSIVADPRITHQARVKIVAKDLRDIANVSFMRPSRQSEMATDNSLFQTYFDCNCSGMSSTAPGSSSKVVGQRVECGGTVKVIAETDSSHPAGIPGQKVIVHIYH